MWIRCDINIFLFLGFILTYALIKQLENNDFPSKKREVAVVIFSLIAIVVSFIVGVITL